MISKIPNSAKIVFPVVKDILKLGIIDIPDQFQGTGAPGNTLEYLLDVKVNNNDSPDLKDWEIKFHGGQSLLTLFHKDPSPRGIMDKMVDTFGWWNENKQLSFRHTLKGKSELGFYIVNEDDKIKIVNDSQPSIVPYWDHDTILNSIGAKLRRLILVHGKMFPKDRKVIYKTAVAYWDLKLVNICKSIKDGTVYIDFDARTTKGKGSSLRNHGTKFRIDVRNMDNIYNNHIIL